MPVIRAEIADRIGRGPRGSFSEVAKHLGMARQTLTKRLHPPDENAPQLDVAEIGAIAKFLRAPIGWPFVPWDIAHSRLGYPPEQ